MESWLGSVASSMFCLPLLLGSHVLVGLFSLHDREMMIQEIALLLHRSSFKNQTKSKPHQFNCRSFLMLVPMCMDQKEKILSEKKQRGRQSHGGLEDSLCAPVLLQDSLPAKLRIWCEDL